MSDEDTIEPGLQAGGYGSFYAIKLLEEANSEGRKLSIRKAARLAGVSHPAVIAVIKRRNKQVEKDSIAKSNIVRFRAMRMALADVNRVPCPKCSERSGYSIRLVTGFNLEFTCSVCKVSSSEKELEW